MVIEDCVTFRRLKKFFFLHGTSRFLLKTEGQYPQKYVPHCLNGEQIKDFIRDTHAKSVVVED